MKPTAAIAFLLLLVSQFAFGETFIGPTNPTNRLLVASNSAVIITTTLGNFTNLGIPQPEVDCSTARDGKLRAYLRPRYAHAFSSRASR